MKKRLLRFLLGTFIVAVLVIAAGYVFRYEILRRQMGLDPYTHSPEEILEERVAMRDGVELATSVHLPAGGSSWPTVVIRNPYSIDALESWCGIFARYGYACVYQETRGRGESEGDWEPMVNEPPDGKDTLKWLLAQTWQNGNIGLYGPSYLGAVQWAVADDLPPEVKTFVPMVFGTDLHRMVYERGMFRHEIGTAWATLMPDKGMRSENGPKYQAGIRHRPHIEMDTALLGMTLPWYREWVSSGSREAPLWQDEAFLALHDSPAKLQVPILMVGGWFDVFFAAQYSDYTRLATKENSLYVVGPWNHLQMGAGQLEYEDDRDSGYQWKLVLDWFGHHLRGEPLEHKGGAIETYVVGEGTWARRESWPPETRVSRWHLTNATKSRSCDGGGLAHNPAEQEETVGYAYDPDDPVPMQGGSGTLAFILKGFGDRPSGPVDQETLCERGDVLTFISKPLPEGLHIAGQGTVRLTVSSDAEDTAFTAKLIEVFPDGRAINIRDSIATLAYRTDSSAPEAYVPGEQVEVTIDFWPIEWRVTDGSRLRLDVSSSNFPMYHAHPNKAGPWAEVTEAVVANQTIFTGGSHAAYIDLPVCADCDAPATTVATAN